MKISLAQRRIRCQGDRLVSCHSCRKGVHWGGFVLLLVLIGRGHVEIGGAWILGTQRCGLGRYCGLLAEYSSVGQEG